MALGDLRSCIYLVYPPLIFHYGIRRVAGFLRDQFFILFFFILGILVVRDKYLFSLDVSAWKDRCVWDDQRVPM